MKRSTKVILGAATFWPIIYFPISFILIFLTTFQMENSPSNPPVALLVVIPFHLLTGLLCLGLFVFYIVNVFKNDQVEQSKKALWAVVLFLGGVIAMPIYWYLYIWREPRAITEALSLNRA